MPQRETPKSAPKPLAKGKEHPEVKLGQHGFLLYESRKQLLSTARAFFEYGLENLQKCLYLADEHTAPEVIRGLGGKHSLQEYLTSGLLQVLSREDTELKNSFSDPKAMLQLVQKSTKQARLEGYGGLSVLWEMPWSQSGGVDLDMLEKHEGGLNRFLSNGRARVICAYNRHRFPDSLLVQALRTHPQVAYGDQLANNLYYAGKDNLTQGLKCLLDNMRRVHEERQRLQSRIASLESLAPQRSIKLEEENTALTSIKEMAAAIYQSLNLDEVLHTILKRLGQMIQADGGAIFLLDQSGILRVEETWGVNDIFRNAESAIPSGECLCGLAAEKGELVISPQMATDPRVTRPGCLDVGFASRICLPLRADKVIGVISMGSRAPNIFQLQHVWLLEAVAPMVTNAVKNAQLHQVVLEMARKDPLTGLANRRHYQESLLRELARASRTGTHFSQIAIDVDGLKSINDRYGHPAGDELLRGIARVLRQSVRAMDLPARYGGDEFLVLLPGADQKIAEMIAARITEQTSNLHIKFDDEWIKASLSLGLVTYPTDATNSEELLRLADERLYRDKNK